MDAKILVVEDELAIAELIRMTLETEGFEVSVATSGESALDLVAKVLPDAALIDWMLPGISGLALAQRLRGDPRTAKLALLMLTARAEEADRIAGLEQGADDYLTKPFSPRELVARMRAVLRRGGLDATTKPMVIGPLTLDPAGFIVRVHGDAVDVGPTEFRLLRFLMSQPGRAFTRAQLLGKVWDERTFIEERTVDVHIRRLRLALGPTGGTMVETIRGVGYRLARPAR